MYVFTASEMSNELPESKLSKCLAFLLPFNGILSNLSCHLQFAIFFSYLKSQHKITEVKASNPRPD